jgi:predicted XRE-type DNA-binding protein
MAMNRKRFSSVWDAIEDTPDAAENMKLRSALMLEIAKQIEDQGLTQAQAAKRLGVTQPRVSDLMRGKIDLFGLDALVNLAKAVGLKVGLRVVRARAA